MGKDTTLRRGKKLIRTIAVGLCFGLQAIPLSALAAGSETSFWLEGGGGPVFQSRNDVQIPADSGSRFSLSDGSAGPFAAYRVYAGLQLFSNHELLGLWAPLSIDGSKKFPKNIDFRGETFAKNQTTDFLYKFNSYRLAYRYLFIDQDGWVLKAGLTGKVRDARIQLQQGNLLERRDDLGFVPLVHFYLGYAFNDNWMLEFYGDALVSPFGRAEDIALKLAYIFDEHWSVSGGYRTVEGGSEGGGSVYTFAWLHYLELSIKYTF